MSEREKRHEVKKDYPLKDEMTAQAASPVEGNL
jgi:hypothetical protein